MITLLNYTDTKESITLEQLLINSFREYIRTKNSKLISIATNWDPQISCYNSAPTFINKIASNDELFDLFIKIYELLSNDLTNLSNPDALTKIMEQFSFSFYPQANIKDIYKKIMFYEFTLIPGKLINADIIAKQFNTTPDYLEAFSFPNDNRALKKYLQNNIEELDYYYFLTKEEIKILKDELTNNTKPKKTLHCLYIDITTKDAENNKMDYLKIIKSNKEGLQKRLRKSYEASSTINYIVCDDNTVIFIFNEKLIKSTKTGTIAVSANIHMCQDLPLELSKIDYKRNAIKIDKITHLVTEEELIRINKTRQILGIQDATLDEVNRPLYFINLPYYNTY
ncbi:MAG: hypothetical protein K5923_05930 [Clostridia bacterium]|nr:hypothetical protein [Clostridia bacterium]